MQLIHPGPEEGMLALRAMRMVAQADGEIGPAALALVTAAESFLLGLDVPLDALAPITPAELAAGLTAPLAAQLCQGMIVVSLADGPPSDAAWARITEFAAALQVDLPALRTIQKLMEHHMLLFKLDFMRRSHITEVFRQQFRHHGGIRGLAEGILGMRGLHEDPALAARFIAFGDLPEETLGYRFFHHYRENGFAFPGQKLGFPVAGVYHDFAHVLGGYPPSPEGEMLVGGLVAGFLKQNPFYMILFTQFTFGAGLNVTPVKQPTIKSILATPGLAPRFFRAIERGAAMNTDLSNNWDFWELVPLPVEEARERLGLAAE